MGRKAVVATGLVAGRSHLVPRSKGSDFHVRCPQLTGATPRRTVKHQQPRDHMGANTDKRDEHNCGPTDEIALPAAPSAVVHEVACLEIVGGCKRHCTN